MEGNVPAPPPISSAVDWCCCRGEKGGTKACLEACPVPGSLSGSLRAMQALDTDSSVLGLCWCLG